LKNFFIIRLQELQEIISLAEEIKELKEPEKNIFAHDSSSEDEMKNDENINNDNMATHAFTKQFIQFQKREELVFDDKDCNVKVVNSDNSSTMNSNFPTDQSNVSQISRTLSLRSETESDYGTDSESDSNSNSECDSEFDPDVEENKYKNIDTGSQLSNQNMTNNEQNIAMVNPKFKHIAEWEKFERGVGSKILAKYGYVKGMGLGKSKKGIAEPLTISEQSGNTRAGLGHQKRRRKRRLPSEAEESEEYSAKRKRKRDTRQEKDSGKWKKRKRDSIQMTEESTTTIFDFLNQQLTATEISPSTKKETYDKFKGLSFDELKKRHTQYKIQLEEHRLEKEKLEKIYQYSKNKDPEMALKAKKQLHQLLTKMKLLSDDEKILSTRVLFTEGRKKMEQF
jgi:hypothetical protein